MGASADQIEREIREARARMDQNLGELEERAASNAVRYGRIAAVAALITGAGIAGFLVYRRLRRPASKARLERVTPEALRELAVEIGARLKEKFPSVTVTVNEKTQREPGRVQSIVRKVAPTLMGVASTAVIRRMTRGSDARVEPRPAASD